METDRVEEMVIVDADAKGQALGWAKQHHVQIEEVTTRGFEPISTVTLILVGSSLAVGAVVHLIDRSKGGQVIDLRPGAPRPFFRTPDVTYGLVVIITTDGSVSVEVKEPRGMFGTVVQALQETLVNLGKEGVDEVAATSRKALRDLAPVEVSENVEQAPDA